MATHSSLHAWKILWREEPGGLQPMGSRLSTRTDTLSWIHLTGRREVTWSSFLVSGSFQMLVLSPPRPPGHRQGVSVLRLWVLQVMWAQRKNTCSAVAENRFVFQVITQRGNEAADAGDSPQSPLSPAAHSPLAPSPSGMFPLVSLMPVPKGSLPEPGRTIPGAGAVESLDCREIWRACRKKPGQQGWWGFLGSLRQQHHPAACESRVRLFATPRTVVHGMLQTRILEWVTYPFSSGSAPPRNQTRVSSITGGFFTSWAIREALSTCIFHNWSDHGRAPLGTSPASLCESESVKSGNSLQPHGL